MIQLNRGCGGGASRGLATITLLPCVTSPFLETKILGMSNHRFEARQSSRKTEDKYELSSGTCAWRGCRKSFKGELPHDWIRLCAYWSAMPDTKKMIVDVAKSPFCKRNSVLCSKHAAELEGMLKPPDSKWKAV